MDRWVLALTEPIPDQLQIPVLASGILLAGHAARELDRIYPLGFRMEPFVGTPFVVWGTLWLGIGVAVIGLGLADESVLRAIPLFRFSDGQRAGLLVSGILLALPFVPLWLGSFWGLVLCYFFGLVLYLFMIPSGLAGVATTLVWRVGELLLSAIRAD